MNLKQVGYKTSYLPFDFKVLHFTLVQNSEIHGRSGGTPRILAGLSFLLFFLFYFPRQCCLSTFLFYKHILWILDDWSYYHDYD